MDQEVKDARAKLAARFEQAQIGGKGKHQVPTHKSDRYSEKEQEEDPHSNSSY
jgi:hypothetical protein